MMGAEIRHGYCQCGCGHHTKLASQTRSARGHVRGKPIRYLRGHNNSYLGGPEYEVMPDGCWEWQGWHTRYGKKEIQVNGVRKTISAHRYMYEKYKGIIPVGLEIDHLCRNTACVNPDHLEAVTRAENVRRSRSAKLTHEDICLIRKRIAKGEKQKVIAAELGVYQQAISKIICGQNWRGVR